MISYTYLFHISFVPSNNSTVNSVFMTPSKPLVDRTKYKHFHSNKLFTAMTYM